MAVIADVCSPISPSYGWPETGGLFRLAVGLMQAFSHDKRCYRSLLDQLALYFQIRDDLINLSSADYMKGKSFCEDLTVSTTGNIDAAPRAVALVPL